MIRRLDVGTVLESLDRALLSGWLPILASLYSDYPTSTPGCHLEHRII